MLDRAKEVADEINAAGDSAVAAQADVTDFDAVQAMVADAGTVDILVNNAGNAGADPSALTGKPFWMADPPSGSRSSASTSTGCSTAAAR